MGILFSFLDFFDACHRQNAIVSPVLALGSLEIHEPTEDILDFAKRSSYSTLYDNGSVRGLFRDRYGVLDYRDCDINGNADIDLDLNVSVPCEFDKTGMTIINGGTLEHIFNISQALSNIHRIARAGAVIIHLSPITWYQHGFYNFDPHLFSAVAEKNNYTLIAEAYWLKDTGILPIEHRGFAKEGNKIGMLERFIMRARGRVLRSGHAIGQNNARLFLTFDGSRYTDNVKLIDTILRSDLIPRNALYLAAYKKNDDADFYFPYDIQC